MKISNITMTVAKLNMFDKRNQLNFEHILQRPSGQWDIEQKTLFIHSLIENYPIPPVYVTLEDSVYNVLDGKQRMTTILDFLNNEFALSENMPEINLFGLNIAMAGEYFYNLPEDVQIELLNSSITFFKIEDYKTSEITDMFYRLNNGTQLSKIQQAKAVMTYSLNEYISKCIAHDFMRHKAMFSPIQLKTSQNESVIVQSLMLLNKYEFKSFSEKDMLEYLRRFSIHITEHSKTRLLKALDYIDKSTEVQYHREGGIKHESFFRKINIPILLFIADKAQQYNISHEAFKDWLAQFNKDYESSNYKNFCGAGSVRRDKIDGRLTIATNHFNKFLKKYNKNPIQKKEKN